MADKTFINGIYIKEFQFSNGGSKLSVSIKVDKFIEDLRKHENEKGYVNIDILKKREVDEKGNSHYCTLNDWKPRESNGFDVANDKNKSPNIEDAEVIDDGNDDLPF